MEAAGKQDLPSIQPSHTLLGTAKVCFFGKNIITPCLYNNRSITIELIVHTEEMNAFSVNMISKQLTSDYVCLNCRESLLIL